MKLDYKYLKEMLLIMEAEKSSQISCYSLFEKMEIDQNDENNNPERDKIIGHLELLNDNNCIESDTQNLGFNTGGSNKYVGMSEGKYRMTSDGHEFLKMLKNKGVFNKIKGLSIKTAIEAGKALLIKQVIG